MNTNNQTTGATKTTIVTGSAKKEDTFKPVLKLFVISMEHPAYIKIPRTASTLIS